VAVFADDDVVVDGDVDGGEAGDDLARQKGVRPLLA
jgi:hypothetical protein